MDCFLCLYYLFPHYVALSLSFKSAKTHIREEWSRNAAFWNKNKYSVSTLVPMFPDRMGIKETGSIHGVELSVVPLPRSLQAWGLLGFIIIWGPIFSQVYLEREGEWW